ncbi:Pr6Pr family membrane protein [Corynebacterium pygosceleis]|uniref:Pr6Pr family membrane protein n=1 Tax=Corynebacterium pygosceleis TaxID=2800406 RepID=A0A9Q4CBG7_9CORY|nr:Pr6Pr family membrane protein [Corynebacterium pygosceleis]MCK7638424.1 Pr6Pr family membrane protein [Corynebacterium pygosceleis]MCK7675404.1 Pr6Pr family membrane protein [Corynebacterium pygosceleis]MCL0121202.1 Pr6Pr family membrane protein [Corynebacterium pygosceleis]MCX7445416.1 Pr6Pr family membrane protein [Corynebacterium pygosceleis]MCX7469088.1 Pr6Pr family membrane protein [Corynebacterium pygosceleis]
MRSSAVPVIRFLGIVAAVLGVSAAIVGGYGAATTPFTDFPAFGTPGEKLVAYYSYFTLWSNILGAVAGLSYAFLFVRGRDGGWLGAVLRLDATIMLMATGLVYHLLIADGSPNTGTQAFTAPVIHGIMPVLLPVIWLLHMTRRHRPDVRLSTLLGSLVIPLVWTAWTFWRAHATGGYYPYNFMDATEIGLARSATTTAMIYVIFIVFMLVLGLIERLVIPRLRPARYIELPENRD